MCLLFIYGMVYCVLCCVFIYRYDVWYIVCCVVCYIQAPDPVNLILYANGLVLFNGPFRPFSEPSTRSMVRDILDGYFPSELQDRYPEGIPLKVLDT